MRAISQLLLLICMVGDLCRGDPLTIMRAMANSRAGVAISFEARVEPSGEDFPMRGFGGGVHVGDELVHRFMLQRSKKIYFGYDIQIDPAEEQDKFQLRILPLSMEQAGVELMDLEGLTAVSLARYPAPQTVRIGDTLSLDLLINPYTGQKVVDYLTIGDPLRGKTATGQAHDFAASDAELQVNKPRISVNGTEVEVSHSEAVSLSGHIVRIYLRQYGRLGFSLVPRVLPTASAAAFLKAGEIRGSTLTFQLGGNNFEINCEGQIAPGPGAYNLYVSHEPAYRPARDVDFFFGAESVMERLLH